MQFWHNRFSKQNLVTSVYHGLAPIMSSNNSTQSLVTSAYHGLAPIMSSNNSTQSLVTLASSPVVAMIVSSYSTYRLRINVPNPVLFQLNASLRTSTWTRWARCTTSRRTTVPRSTPRTGPTCSATLSTLAFKRIPVIDPPLKDWHRYG